MIGSGDRRRREAIAASPCKSQVEFCDPAAWREGRCHTILSTPDDVLRIVRDEATEMIDRRFTDLPGLWQHFSIPPRALDDHSFTDGAGFDGSSIRGFHEIQESDMLVVPDPTTAFHDPFAEAPTLALICNVVDPLTGQAYNRDPRLIARKAEHYLHFSGVDDLAYFGPELEHFVFNEVHYDQGVNYGYYNRRLRGELPYEFLLYYDV
jgi:glutamine synthetase